VPARIQERVREFLSAEREMPGGRDVRLSPVDGFQARRT